MMHPLGIYTDCEGLDAKEDLQSRLVQIPRQANIIGDAAYRKSQMSTCRACFTENGGSRKGFKHSKGGVKRSEVSHIGVKL